MFELGYAVVGLEFWVSPLGYVGPGAGLSMLGALLTVCVLLLFALLSPVLYVVRWIRSFFTRQSAPMQLEVHPVVNSKQ